MTLTTEELNTYTTLVVELKRLEELERQHKKETEILYKEIRDKYNFDDMNTETIALSGERAVSLKVIKDQIEAIRLELIK